jgi:starch synthase (maltosyl-transferring)
VIRYAENPPKRYYDIYHLYFENKKWKELWEEMARIVFFWIEKGIKIFRVDNPHTKPAGFWLWLIEKVQEKHPDVIFLSEAFTRPKVMRFLAKIGFTQSYTYFTWKNTKQELEEFLREFVLSDAAEYYRGNFFTNTPDILHEYLQKGGRPAFKTRLVLAATLSSLYGIYNGYELCENTPKEPGSEEYLDSEKYQYKVRDWNKEGNIKNFIAKVNAIRRENPALHETRNLRLLQADNANIFFYGKWTKYKENIILVVVNLDPSNTHESTVFVPIHELSISPWENYVVHDLITDERYLWKGEANYVKLNPNKEPAHILLLER